MFPQYPPQQWEQPGRAQVYSSPEPYFESGLRPEDGQTFSAAGLMLYRTGATGAIEVLVGVERPWNSFINDYDPLAWNVLGGKRAAGKGKEWEPYATVVRSILDIAGAIEGVPSSSDIKRLCQSGPAMWYPRGKYALYLSQVTDEMRDAMDKLPERFLEGKAKGLVPAPQDEQRLGWNGQPTTKWVKEIDELEWVPIEDIIKPAGETRKPVTNLLENICLGDSFRKFAETGVLPSNAQPGAVSDNHDKKEGKNGEGNSDRGGGVGKSGAKGFRQKGGDDRKGGGKGGKGQKGDWGKKGKGGYGAYSMSPQQPMQMSSQMYSPEVQRQVLGEQVYILVQPMVPTAAIAQKVTGMLLELPLPELLPVMESTSRSQKWEGSELKKRVDEALEVLQVEGYAGVR